MKTWDEQLRLAEEACRQDEEREKHFTLFAIVLVVINTIILLGTVNIVLLRGGF